MTSNPVDRLKIPPLSSLNKSSSAFDELGKKLNHLPSFQKSTLSMTSLHSMHSMQSMQSVNGDNLRLQTSGPSLHSINSFRTLTANNPYDHDQNTPPIGQQPSFDIDISSIDNIQSINLNATTMNNKPWSFSQSLPSIPSLNTNNLPINSSISTTKLLNQNKSKSISNNNRR